MICKTVIKSAQHLKIWKKKQQQNIFSHNPENQRYILKETRHYVGNHNDQSPSERARAASKFSQL